MPSLSFRLLLLFMFCPLVTLVAQAEEERRHLLARVIVQVP